MENRDYSFKELRQMFAETDKKFAETDKKFAETGKYLKEIGDRIDSSSAETDKFLKEIGRQLGGISHSNGEFAESFFFHGFSATMQIGSIKYDYIEPNKHRKLKDLEDEYDIVLVNSNKIMVIEVKYKLQQDHVTNFYEKKIPKFKQLFPEFKDYTVHGAMAALSITERAKKMTLQKGLVLFTQAGENIKKVSPNDLIISVF